MLCHRCSMLKILPNYKCSKDIFRLYVKGTAYICSEDVFPNKRLHQMIQHFTARTAAPTTPSVQCGDKIFIEHVADIVSILAVDIIKYVPKLISPVF